MAKGKNSFQPSTVTTGNDFLVGTSGTDFMNGGPGDDTLSGGASPDVFGLSSNGGGKDVITDFQATGMKHDMITFDGFGAFVDAVNNVLPAQRLADGMTFVTNTGHVLTVTDTGNDTLLSWDTGDSITLVGMDPGSMTADLIVSYEYSYNFVW